MSDIFNEGKIVESPAFPAEGFSDNFKKWKWGRKILREYVSKFYGNRGEEQSAGRMDRLTGTKIVVREQNKTTEFMLVEPRKNVDRIVHIVKKVEDTSHGDDLDFLDYKYSTKSAKDRAALKQSPFAVLAALSQN